MTRFQKLYNQILEGLTSFDNVCTSHYDFRKPLIKPGFSDDFSFIVNETVKSVELTPVLADVLYEFYKIFKIIGREYIFNLRKR